MWFKQIQLYRLPEQKFSVEKISEKLAELAFTPCLPSLPGSAGWVSPFEDEEEDAPLCRAINGNIMLCLQIEEKILPNAVITQTLKEKIKQIETRDDRRIRQKEKLSLKDEVTFSLLPRAFSKLTRLYAYIDTKNHWLVVSSNSAPKIEQFMALFKRTICENVFALDLIKPTAIFTHWLKTQKYPNIFSIENACVLQDPNQQKRVIRCQNQNLFVQSIQDLIKDGCEVKQLALAWQDRLQFVLSEDFSFKSIQYGEDILTHSKEMGETKRERFDADFYIMAETLTGLFNELLPVFMKQKVAAPPEGVIA